MMKRSLAIMLSILMLAVALPLSGMAEVPTDAACTLTVMSYYNDDVVNGWIAAFNAKYPNITVQNEYIGDLGTYIEKLQALLMSKSAPDIYLCIAENRRFLTAGGYVVDLTDTPVNDLVSDAAKKQVEYQGRLYAACTGGSIGGLLVNLDLCKQAGISGAPATWSELVEDLKKLQAIGCIPLADRTDDAAVALMTAMYGAEYMDTDATWMDQIAAGEKTHAEYWQPIFERYQKDIVANGLMTQEIMGVSSEKMVSNFALGKVGMMVGASWNFPSIAAMDPELNFTIWGIPNEDGSSKYYFGDCLEPSLAVNANSPHKEEAIAFLESLFTAESLNSFEVTNGFVACVEGYDSIFLNDPRMSDAIKEGMNTGSQFMPQTMWDKNVESMRNYYLSAMQSLVLGEKTPEELAQGFDEVYAQ